MCDHHHGGSWNGSRNRTTFNVPNAERATRLHRACSASRPHKNTTRTAHHHHVITTRKLSLSTPVQLASHLQHRPTRAPSLSPSLPPPTTAHCRNGYHLSLRHSLGGGAPLPSPPSLLPPPSSPPPAPPRARVPRAQIASFISTPLVAEDCAIGLLMVVVGMALTIVVAFF